MSEVTDILIPIIKGAFGIFFVLWMIFFFYLILKFTGMLKLIKDIFKRDKKISDEIYEYVAVAISEGETLSDVAQYSSKFSKKTQNQYIDAYLEVKKMEVQKL